MRNCPIVVQHFVLVTLTIENCKAYIYILIIPIVFKLLVLSQFPVQMWSYLRAYCVCDLVRGVIIIKFI